jgi:hypothetical protein
MSGTPVGLVRTDDHQYRWSDGPFVPGITTVMNQKDRSGPLIAWARKETAAKAVRDIAQVYQIIQQHGPDAAIDFVKREPERLRDKAAIRGTGVHLALEKMALGQPYQVTDEEQTYVDAFVRDIMPMNPTFVAVEFMVYSEQHLYGGTGDAIVDIAGERWLLDYKTSKGIYETTAMQLAALAYADFIGVPDDPRPQPIPSPDCFGVIHIQPNGAKLVPYNVTRDDFDAFLACRALYEWERSRKHLIKGPQVRANSVKG